MSTHDLFDELEDYQLTEEVKPFYKVFNKENDKELLSWLVQVKNALIHNAKTRTLLMRTQLHQELLMREPSARPIGVTRALRRWANRC